MLRLLRFRRTLPPDENASYNLLLFLRNKLTKEIVLYMVYAVLTQ